MKTKIEGILRGLRDNVVYALGCTEPVAIALACARARETLGEQPERIILKIDRFTARNACSVGVPSTGERGIRIAAALGAQVGKPEKGLMLLEGVSPLVITAAKKFLEEKEVRILIEDTRDIYISAELSSEDKTAIVVIEGSHTHVARVELTGKVSYEDSEKSATEEELDMFAGIDLPEAVEIVESLPLEEIEFMEQGFQLNLAAAELGIREQAAFGYADYLEKLMESGLLPASAIALARVEAAAASGARMAGMDSPVISSFGSGNQGIVIYSALGAMAREEGFLNPWSMMAEKAPHALHPIAGNRGKDSAEKSREHLLRAVALAHLITGISRFYTGILGPYCGAAVATAASAAVGCVYLAGGDLDQMENAFQLTVASTQGIFCDGAKESCALKVSMGAEAAVQNAYLAMEGQQAPREMGLIGDNFKGTLESFDLLSKEIHSDDVILRMLLEKSHTVAD